MVKDNRALGDPGTPAFRVDKYPFYLLNRSVSLYNRIIEAGLRKVDLDIPYWRVLMVLGESEPRGIGQIATAAVMNLSTTMRVVQRMERDGLVTSRPAPDDARVTEVQLTAVGRSKLQDARGITAPIYSTVIEGFSRRDFDQLIELLNRLHGNLETLK